MKGAFGNMFWGMLIVLLDIRIGFDLMIDPVGYLLIAYGMSRIDKAIPLFRVGKWIAVLLAAVSIPAVFDPGTVGGGFQALFESRTVEAGSWSDIWLTGLLGDFALMLLIYLLCEGICRLAKQQGEAGLDQQMQGAWWLYFVSSAPMMILSPFLLNFDIPGLFAILLVLGFVGLIAFVQLLHGFRRAGRDLDEADPQHRLDIRI